VVATTANDRATTQESLMWDLRRLYEVGASAEPSLQFPEDPTWSLHRATGAIYGGYVCRARGVPALATHVDTRRQREEHHAAAVGISMRGRSAVPASGTSRYIRGQKARRFWRRAGTGPATPSEMAQEPNQPPQSPSARPVPASLHIPDRPRIEAGPGRNLLLREPQPEPGSPKPSRQAVPFRNEPRAEGRLDGRPAPGQGLALAPLPLRDRLRPAAEPLGEGSLR
jgi:hypothetical protein